MHRLNEDNKQIHRMREQLAALTRAGTGGGGRGGGGGNARSVSPGRGEPEPSAPGGSNAELARTLLVQHSQWLKSFAQQLGSEGMMA